MKSLKRYLRFGSVFDDDTIIEEKVPKTKSELLDLIDEYIELFGPECNLNVIDTSHINDMSYLFTHHTEFNGDISGWDVHNVENMEYMFFGTKFNKDISKWNTRKVKNMSYMFMNSIFDNDISKWDVRNVTKMECMFAQSKFNKDISEWNVEKVYDMSYMFSQSKFNGKISKWNTSNVAFMQFMFSNAVFNKNIYKWNISKVRNMSGMFYNNKRFNCDLSWWDISYKVDTEDMFKGCNIEDRYRPMRNAL